MRALIRNPDYTVSLQLTKEPVIKSPNEVKIQIAYCSLCRDDMWIEDKFSIFGSHGIIGHEASGVIVESGEEAQKKGFLPGVRVVIMPINSCGTCERCLIQNPHLCVAARLSPGVWAEYIVRNYSSLIVIPDELTFKQANLMEPVGDIVEAINKLDINFSSEILLIGAGFTGLIFTKLLRMRGARNITVIEPIEERRKLALQYGADQVFDSKTDKLQLTLLSQTNFQGFDLAIDTSARPDIFDFTLPCIANGGTLLMFAYNEARGKLVLPFLDLYAANISLIWSSLCGIQSMKTAASLIMRYNLEQLITAEYSFDDSQAAYEKYLGTSEIKIGVRVSP